MPDMSVDLSFSINFRNSRPKLCFEVYTKEKYFVGIYVGILWVSFSLTLNGYFIPNKKEDARGKDTTQH